MEIIRDEEMGGIMMIPLFHDWRIRRCNVEGCKEKPTTIIVGAHPEALHIGMCENHYQEAITAKVKKYTYVFDGFDAFKADEDEN